MTARVTKGIALPEGTEPVKDRYAQFVLAKDFFASYFRDSHDLWTCVTPNGRLISLAGHPVTEHRDGTITVNGPIVAPVIAPRGFDDSERKRIVQTSSEAHVKMWEQGAPGWAGYLEDGNFIEGLRPVN